MDAVNKLINTLGREETYILLEDICGMKREDILLHRYSDIDENKKTLLEDAIKRRQRGEPIQYITGSWPFMGEYFYVGEGVLIPRDDTEVVVREADRLIKKYCLKSCIDLCSGSGIIAITLKKLNKDLSVTAVEKYSEAYSYLCKNRDKLSADINAVYDDLYTYYKHIEDNSVDILVSNPPYIRSDEIGTLQKEISFEPETALDGGDDGLSFYRAITDRYTDKIKPGGFIALEIGEDQADDIFSILKDRYTDIKIYRDIQGLPRAATARKSLSGVPKKDT